MYPATSFQVDVGAFRGGKMFLIDLVTDRFGPAELEAGKFYDVGFELQVLQIKL